MPRKIKIKIPVLVGSNGVWCSSGSSETIDPVTDTDWGFMADSLVGKDNRWPSAEKRYLINVELDVPDEAPAEVEATAEPLDK